MKIKKLKGEKIQIFLSTKDMEKMGITFEDIDTDDISAKIFIGSLLKILDELEIFKAEKGSIAVDITKLSTNEIIVCFSLQNIDVENTQAAYFFSDCKELIKFCKNTLFDYTQIIGINLLFFCQNQYILLINYKLNKHDFENNKKICQSAVTDLSEIGKIKEYAILISRTPLEKIFDLP